MIIGLTGYAGSGKSTVAHYLVKQHHYREFSFAEPIRKFIADILGLNLTELQDCKQLTDVDLGKSPREMMQTLGTEWGRDLVHPDIWVKALDSHLTAYRSHLNFNAVISDVRFPNEVSYIKSQGGIIVRVERPGENLDEHGHISSKPLPDVDATLRNSRSITNLEAAVDAFIARLPKCPSS